MFTPDDLKPLSAAIGSAAAVGLALGLWLTPSLNRADPVAAFDDSQPIAQIDPNLARYQEMAAANGVGAAPDAIVPAAYTPQEKLAETTPSEDLTFARDDVDVAAPAPAVAPAADSDPPAVATPAAAVAPAQPADSPTTGSPAAD